MVSLLRGTKDVLDDFSDFSSCVISGCAALVSERLVNVDQALFQTFVHVLVAASSSGRGIVRIAGLHAVGCLISIADSFFQSIFWIPHPPF